MNGNLLEAIQSLVKVKKVDADVVFDALEMVLLTAYKKETGSNAKTSIKLNRETGDYQIFEEKTVVESIDPESENAINEITVEDAKKIDRSYEAGDLLSIDVTPKNFGRIAAQTAKQVMIQKLREAERGSLYEEFSGRAGDVITGTVKWSESRAIFVDLGRCEGILPYAEQIEGEEFKANDKIKCYVLEVKKTTKGPEIILSRTHPGLLKRLFELEVPEIYSGTVEIKNVVREAGSRSKIAVYAMDPTVDPVGACVGMKGSRIYSIVKELRNENIDVVNYTTNPQLMIQRALNPAKISSITIDEELMDAANMIEGEKVQVLDVDNGERLETYIIKGERGSGAICLNGPAARKVQVGDVVIIASYALLDFEEAKAFKPWVIFPDTKTNKLIR